MTGAERFSVYPFGMSFRRSYTVQTRDLNGDGVTDVIATARLSRKKTRVAVFSGIDGSPLPSSLV